MNFIYQVTVHDSILSNKDLAKLPSKGYFWQPKATASEKGKKGLSHICPKSLMIP